MRYLLEGSQAKCLDQYTIETFGMQSLILMERAAYEVAACIKGLPQHRRCVFIMAGTGNNGADGLALARMLCQSGYQVRIVVVGKTAKATPEWMYQKMLIDKMGIECYPADENTEIPDSYDIYVDALFGIGLKREITGIYRDMTERFMKAARSHSGQIVVAVDISSGICAETGKIYGTAVKADITVSFGYGKLGQMLYPGAAYTGELRVVDIGLAAEGLNQIGGMIQVLDAADARRMFPVCDPGGNKGTFGNVLVIAGAAGMAGAACFAAEAAYRTGAGLVRVYTAPVNHQILQMRLPEAVLICENGESFEALTEAVHRAKTIVIGPGLSVDKKAEQILRLVLKEHGDIPIVIDADALNLLAKQECPLLGEHAVLTPHLGEMSRLLGISVSEIRSMGLKQAAALLYEKTKAAVVCKDARTIVYCAQDRIYLNDTGNDGMATGGSGDVLSGVIAGLAAQGTDIKTAAVLGVYLHGCAGDTAMEQNGRNGMLAADILHAIPEAIKMISFVK